MPLPLLLHAYHSHQNASLEPMGEWIVPWCYRDFTSEYHALQNQCGLLDNSAYAILEIGGTDRIDFLQRLLTNDIARLQNGMGCRAFLLDSSGHIQIDFIVLCHKKTLWLCCDASVIETAAALLERYHFSEDVVLKNLERTYAVFSLAGPATLEICDALFGERTRTADAFSHEWVRFAENDCLLVHRPLPTAIELLAFVPEAHAQTFWNAWLHRGGPHGLTLVGWQAYNTFRIEQGQARHLVDFDARHLLPETGLQKLGASDRKGCYIGQEIVARMETYGTANKHLVGLRVYGNPLPEAGDPLTAEGVDAGILTSVCESPRVGAQLALGFVKRPFYATDTELHVSGSDAKAIVCPLPFVSNL